jgi:hypothetical protein
MGVILFSFNTRMLSLFGPNGKAIEYKTYQVKLFGENQENNNAHLVIKLSKPGSSITNEISSVPSNALITLNSIFLVSFFTNILRENNVKEDLPLISIFLKLSTQPDIFQLLCIKWNDFIKHKDDKKMELIKVLMELWPMTCNYKTPLYVHGSLNSERLKLIQYHLSVGTKDIQENFKENMEAFDMNEYIISWEMFNFVI